MMTVSDVKSSQEQSLVNSGVWLTENRSNFSVGPAPYTHPRTNEIVVRNRAVAINPIDWLMQPIGDIAFPWIKYPFIMGSDVAGEVVEVGTSVTRFKIGDRILGHAAGSAKNRNSSAEGAFQQYTVLVENLVAPIPRDIAYEDAVVLPLGLSTAACGLFQKDHLALQYPSAQPKPTGQTILIWGGSTSVGSNAIQLAVAAGYEVITTASPKNFDYVKKLGASQAFDYNSETVVKELIKAFSGKFCAGALAIGVGSGAPCVDVIHASRGAKFVSLASPPISFDDAPVPRTISWLIPTMMRMISANVSFMTTTTIRGIKTKFIFGTSLMDNEVGKIIYEDFLPNALAHRRYLCAPDPLVVGNGLDCILKGIEIQKKGVSAQKVVVTL